MRISEAIAKVDNLYPNQYGADEKVTWLSILDSQIHTDIIETHEFIGLDGKPTTPPPFVPYSVEDTSVILTAPFPYDEMYVTYLKCKIDEMNEETDRYNNHAILYNSQLDQYSKWYNRKHKPLQVRMHYVGRMKEANPNERIPDIIPRQS